MDQAITKEKLEQFGKEFHEKKLNEAAMYAVTANGLNASAKNHEAARNLRHVFSVSLKQGEITDQMRSGRCWMFAALNVFRSKVIREWKLETFELSQNYTLFYDKLEKANFFLESILETLDEPTQGRLISFLLSSPMNDGGQWDMLCNLIEKYGLVPKEAMPETKSSSATGEMDACLTRKLREDACRLRAAHAQGVSLEELYQKYVGLALEDYISLINAPTADKPYHKSYSVKFLGNVKEGRPVRYLNLEIGELKGAAIAQLQDGEPVWFGCDVGKESSRDGIMDTGLYRLDTLLDMPFGMTKAERLDYGESLMTHAMVFQGVNLDEAGKPDRWRVENSWGDKAGEKGYYVMSDAWFDEYMYQVVVNKKYLPEELVKEYESEPIMLEPWDPMGSLAGRD